MKKLLTLIIAAAMFSCSDSQNEQIQDENANPVLGKWQLIQQLADPGDGSGTFQPVDSDKILIFKTDGILNAQNVSLCDPYTTQSSMTGKYDNEKGEITTGCEDNNIAKVFFSMEGEMLRLDYISNEGFSQLYQSIE